MLSYVIILTIMVFMLIGYIIVNYIITKEYCSNLISEKKDLNSEIYHLNILINQYKQDVLFLKSIANNIAQFDIHELKRLRYLVHPDISKQETQELFLKINKLIKETT